MNRGFFNKYFSFPVSSRGTHRLLYPVRAQAQEAEQLHPHRREHFLLRVGRACLCSADALFHSHELGVRSDCVKKQRHEKS